MNKTIALLVIILGYSFYFSLQSSQATSEFHQSSRAIHDKELDQTPSFTLETTIIPYNSPSYRYLISTPNGLPQGYERPGFDDSSWSIGDAGFGSGGFCPIQQSAKTYWPTLSEVAIRKLFDLPTGATNIRVGIAIDNDFQLFINGHDISGIITHEYCTNYDEFVLSVPQNYLQNGRNLIVVRGIDRGDQSYLDISVTADLLAPFLDLPFAYEQHHSLALQNWNQPSGRIESWFDHDLPNRTIGQGLLISNGTRYMIPQGDKVDGFDCFGISPETRFCYDGHNGYDFSGGSMDVVAAGGGIVEQAGCGGFGNQVIIDHGNGYFTLYGHLSRIDVNTGDSVTRGQLIGRTGGTGYFSNDERSWCANRYSTHLHFGVYRDDDGQGVWEGGTIDKPLDPNGFFGISDPWIVAGGPNSYWFWMFERSRQSYIPSNQDTALTDISGNITINIPAGYFDEDVTLELLREPEIAGASASLRNVGLSFWLHLLELIGRNQLQPSMSSTTNVLSSASDPITMTITYSDTETIHLDEGSLGLYHWNETLLAWEAITSTVDTSNNIISALSPVLGHFNLQAPSLCTADEFITDDSYYGAIPIVTDGSLTHRLFDVPEDEDWFSVGTITGTTYVVESINLAQSMDTRIELYDRDGITLLDADDNGGSGFSSKLEWIAPASGVYFYRVIRNSGSAFGCNATYDLKFTTTNKLYLPITKR